MMNCGKLISTCLHPLRVKSYFSSLRDLEDFPGNVMLCGLWFDEFINHTWLNSVSRVYLKILKTAKRALKITNRANKETRRKAAATMT